tara:strand:+ start:257 stop:829 length:573 start_codon:yes stop_codon:yes gene_type:complete
MWPILVVFIIGLIFVIERLIHLIKSLSTKESFAEDIATTIASAGVNEAKSKSEGAVGPVANLCNIALEEANNGEEAVEKALDQAGTIEMATLEKNMTWISLSIAVAPMLGFLGTVVGMVSAFDTIAEASDIDASMVAGGISEALLTTAFGLICAVILQMLQNGVIYIIDNQILTMQRSSMMLVKSINKKK